MVGGDMTTGFIDLVGDSPECPNSQSIALLVREPAPICFLTEKA